MDAADNDLTTSQWAGIRAAWGGCAYCGSVNVPLQRDCVLPLSRGGRYTIENIVPACRSCNASKSNGEVTSWMRRKRLDERAFLLRHALFLQDLAAESASPPGTAEEGRA
jgi:5-methylcytosine-specific restriction endonuclease McrA